MVFLIKKNFKNMLFIFKNIFDGCLLFILINYHEGEHTGHKRYMKSVIRKGNKTFGNIKNHGRYRQLSGFFFYIIVPRGGWGFV